MSVQPSPSLSGRDDSVPPYRLAASTFYGQLVHERVAEDFALAVRTADPWRSVERHAHEDAHFVLVLEGAYRTAAHRADEGAAPLLVYNPPGTTHRDHFAARDGRFAGRFFTLSVGTDTARSLLGMPLDDAASVALWHPDAHAIVRLLLRECERWTSDSAIVSTALGTELLAHVQRAAPPIRTVPSWLPRTLTMLRDRCTAPVSVRELAAEAGVHPVYLARVFRRIIGCSPGELQRQARLDQAIAWLRHTRRPISEIAARTGYADQSHLHRAVLRHTGVRPGAMRPSGTR